MSPHINFHMPGYKTYRADHPSGSREGGSAIFIKTCIKHSEMLPIRRDEVQVARVKMKINDNDYNIGSFYSAPDRDNRHLRLNTLWDTVREMGPKFLLGGDFNAKHPRWASATTNPRGRLLHETVLKFNLEVFHPMEPTHYPRNTRHSPDILDIFIGKDLSNMAATVDVHHSLSSDHYPVMVNFNGLPTCNSRVTLTHHPFDWKRYSDLLNEITDLSIPLKTPQDIDAAVGQLTFNIHYAANEARTPCHYTTHRRHIYSPPHIEDLHMVKRNARRLWEQTKYPAHKTAYNRASRELKTALSRLRDDENRNKLLQLEVKNGSLFHKAKSLMKQPGTIPPLNHNGHWLCSPSEKAEVFAERLNEQFSPNPSHMPDFHETIEEAITEPLDLSPLRDFFTPSQVRNAIKRTSAKKSPGSDRIGQPLLNHLSRKTITLLTQIYNAMLRTTHFPHKWKHAEIIIPKPLKPTNNPSSYRPISLLSIFSKLFERLLLPKLLPYLIPAIPNFQFGFRHHHSCEQQLHRLTEEILESFEAREVCLGLFTDTEKAFDRVWHPGLLYKLKPLLPDTYYRIILSFLTGRTFHVKCDDAHSSSGSIRASVPQGSVWGPILYLVYVGDIPTRLGTSSFMFADDHAVLSRNSSGTTASRTLQDLADDIQHWTHQWRISINSEKSCTATFTLKHNYQTLPIMLNNANVPSADVVRYLGIHLQQRLTFSAHISELLKRIRTRIHLLKPLLGPTSVLSLEYKRLLYLTMIKPIWQYGCSVWGLACASQIKRIQTQQNRVLRLISGAPWYVRNSILHRDLDIPEVQDAIALTMSRLKRTIMNMDTPAFSELLESWNRQLQPRRLKRKRTTDITES
ncbi:Retrotransposon protein [Nesidiocoris tenuis]|uniref:Retrotransposon protein n=2 Tax=Nesidiocoris tenuis TaxID=355587 RepID=A0ABN7A6Y2_9HEMI|nr:Retrotransposon protein [Nesidiocoris tenuis]